MKKNIYADSMIYFRDFIYFGKSIDFIKYSVKAALKDIRSGQISNSIVLWDTRFSFIWYRYLTGNRLQALPL